MQQQRFTEMKSLIGFTDDDTRRLVALSPTAADHIPAIVEHFYAVLLNDADAQNAFSNGEDQIRRLRDLVSIWLTEVFGGTYETAYFEKRLAIGTTHVRVGLSQHLMVLGVELIWNELECRLRRTDFPDIDTHLRSVHKILSLDLAIMLESYKEGTSDRVRQSERSVLEKKLTRAEHLAEIGQLAASLAHEIKNPLAGISGAIQVIRDTMSAEDPHQPIIKEILGQINRLDDTVKDLLVYARPPRPRTQVVSLSDITMRVLTLLHEEPSVQRVRVVYQHPPTPVPVCADEHHLEQLLMNLVINAAHASENGQDVLIEVIANANQTRLVVTDSGSGMTPDVRTRAFEPFYTTKAKGTGLGLAICRTLVQANEGSITLNSEPGQGTTVAVTLPSQAPPPAERMKP